MSYGNAIALIIQSLDSSLSGRLIYRDLRLFATRNRDLEKIAIAYAIHSLWRSDNWFVITIFSRQIKHSVLY